MKKLLLLISIVFVTASCADFLVEYPHTSITSDKAISTVKDVNYAVNGMYDLMAIAGYYSGAIFYYGDVKGDDVQSLYQSGRDVYYCYMFAHVANGLRAGSLWGRPWYVIRQASNIIAAIEGGKVTGTKEELNDYLGQAYAVRALAHFDLLKCFGYPYAKDNGASWGVPTVDHVLALDEYPLRKTVAESYDFIIGQMNKAIPLLSKDKNNGHINQYAARALLARIYLYCEKNKEAYDTASALIEELKGTSYQLASHDGYIAQFALNNTFRAESLFEIAHSQSDNPSWDALSYLYHWWGYADMIVTLDFINLLREDPNDVRWGLVSNERGQQWWLMKYPGPRHNTAAVYNNYPVVRVSEVYLIAAEAAVKGGGDKTKGLEYLNAIVNRANPAKTVAAADYDLDRVLKERRLELVGEGHRYFDRKRLGLDILRPEGLPTVPYSDYRVVAAIGTTELDVNKKLVQNPGY